MKHYQIIIDGKVVVFDKVCTFEDVQKALKHLADSFKYSDHVITYTVLCLDMSEPEDVATVGVFDLKLEYQKLPENFTFSDILEITEMSIAALSQRFGIPYRTAQDWKSGKRNPPEYVLKMIASSLNMYTHF